MGEGHANQYLNSAKQIAKNEKEVVQFNFLISRAVIKSRVKYGGVRQVFNKLPIFMDRSKLNICQGSLTEFTDGNHWLITYFLYYP